MMIEFEMKLCLLAETASNYDDSVTFAQGDTFKLNGGTNSTFVRQNL